MLNLEWRTSRGTIPVLRFRATRLTGGRLNRWAPGPCELVLAGGSEPPTFAFVARCFSLSYARIGTSRGGETSLWA